MDHLLDRLIYYRWLRIQKGLMMTYARMPGGWEVIRLGLNSSRPSSFPAF